jgi:small-conductance mechanosensitive channel
MEEQTDFLSPKHKQLLRIAAWAKYLAWVALILAIIYAGTSTVLTYLVQWRMVQQFEPFVGTTNDILSLLNGNPDYLAELTIDFIFGVLKGVIYYLVLKSVSLGLNMIVETDINYRDKNVVDGKNANKEEDNKLTDDEPGLETWEAKLLDSEDQPDFFDTLDIVELIRKLNKAANWVLVLNVLLGIYNLPITSLIISGFLPQFSEAPYIFWNSLLIVVGTVINILPPYLLLKASVYILRILMEMEFNSRK